VVNGVLPGSEAQYDPLAAAICARERAALDDLPVALRALPCDRIPLLPVNMVGLDALHQLLANVPPRMGSEYVQRNGFACLA
jgi:arsenite-transporting ATPase